MLAERAKLQQQTGVYRVLRTGLHTKKTFESRKV